MMVTNEGVLKIIDFGLAIPYKPDFCRPGNRTGTPDYMAPELIKRQRTDHRVDMFALGVTAYEVFSNTFPWERSQSIQTLQDHVNLIGRDPRDWDRFFGIERALLRDIALFPAIGNHEIAIPESEGATRYARAFRLPAKTCARGW